MSDTVLYLALPTVCILVFLGRRSYYVRTAFYAFTMFAVACLGILVGLVYNLVGKKHDVGHWIARCFYEVASRVMNLRVEIVGGEELLDGVRPSVVMCNHQSRLDILILGRAFPRQAAVVSKKSLQFSPMGPFMTLAGAVFIDRGNNARAVQSLNAAGALLNALRISIWVFPEGTWHLTPQPEMLPFKKGGFHLAINAQVPILPVVVEHYWGLYHEGMFGEGVIRLRVLEPIPTIGLAPADVGTLATRVRDAMVEGLHEFSRNTPPPWALVATTAQPIVRAKGSTKCRIPACATLPQYQGPHIRIVRQRRRIRVTCCTMAWTTAAITPRPWRSSSRSRSLPICCATFAMYSSATTKTIFAALPVEKKL